MISLKYFLLVINGAIIAALGGIYLYDQVSPYIGIPYMLIMLNLLIIITAKIDEEIK